MSNKKQEVTKAPSGLRIVRNGNKFIASWKIGDKDYGDGQYLQHMINDTGKDKWLPIAESKKSIGVKTTSKAISIDKDDYYPNKDKKGNNKPILYEIGFRVKGNRKKYTTGSGSKEKTHNPVSSEWTEKKFTIEPPRKPSLTVELDEELTNVCKFSWSTSYSKDDSRIFTDTQWQTMLVQNNSEEDGSKLTWGGSTFQEGTAGAESSKTITEDTSILYKDGNSYTRWFRVRSRGPRGVYNDDKSHGWRYAKHVYALPNKTNVTSTSAKETDEGGFQCIVDWEVGQSSGQKPIDKVFVQYTITVPDEDLSCPNGASWTDANISKDTSDGDAAVFSIDDQLSKDQCLFIRVNTQHDTNITYGTPKLSSVGFLKDPSGLSVQTDNTTHRATVNATNNSDVEDSVLVVRYVPAEGDPIDVGVIAHGSSSVTVQCPDWDDQTAINFEVYAMVGSATKQTRQDNVDSYAINSRMRSQNTISQGGAVPVAPQNVSVNRVEGKADTVQVIWDWPWSEAGSAEISWSDHDDAWESTDEPESFLISNLHASKWNISGLETGKTWYVRVRLISGNINDSDNVTYGPWSDISKGTIDLSSAPNKPVLILSSSVIPEDGSTTASWVYTTTDNTDQAYAEVAILDDDEYTPIAHSLTSQHVTIPASSENYTLTTGNTYNLVCRVQSASGKISEWSDVVSLSIAEPLECDIPVSSLVLGEKEINPRRFTGNPIQFETELAEDVKKLAIDLEPIQDGTPWNATTADVTPYNFRKIPSVGHSINSEYDKIVGGTVAWNQIAPTNKKSGQNTPSGGTTYDARTTGVDHLIPNHVYYISAVYSLDTNRTDIRPYFQLSNNNYGKFGTDRFINVGGSKLLFDGVGKSTIDDSLVAGVTSSSTITSADVWNYDDLYVVDLTHALGATIADYVFNLNTPDNRNWLKEHFPKMFNSGYMAYDSGTLESVEGLQSHDTVGKNLCTNKYYSGAGYNVNAGVQVTLTDITSTVTDDGKGTVSKDSVSWGGIDFLSAPLPKGEYHCSGTINSPNNRLSAYVLDSNMVITRRLWNSTTTPQVLNFNVSIGDGETYILVHAATSTAGVVSATNVQLEYGSTATDYEPYVKHTYALDSDLVLRGILKLDSNNKLYYDGDVYASDGSVTRKYGIVDLGALTWNYESSSTRFYSSVFDNAMTSAQLKTTLLCTRYTENGSPITGTNVDKTMWLYSNKRLYINDFAYTDAASFKTAMSGVYLVYELATPTTETADPFTNPQIVDSDGTEEYVTTSIVPVGHETYYADIYPISGYDEVNVTIRGKNLINVLDGSATTSVSNIGSATVPSGTYTISAFLRRNDGGACRVYIKVGDETSVGGTSVTGNGGISSYTFTVTKETVVVFGVQFMASYDTMYYSNVQLESGSSATDYVPYANETYTAEFENTVYGGKVDLVSGVLTVDMAIVDLGTLNWEYDSSSDKFLVNAPSNAPAGVARGLANVICENYWNAVGQQVAFYNNEIDKCFLFKSTYIGSNRIYIRDTLYANANKFKSAMSGVQLAYKLATPQEIQLTPQQIQTLVGKNYVYSEEGDMNIRIVESYEDGYFLTQMPLEATVSGVGEEGMISVVVERAEDYKLDRPNEDEFNGYKGETVLQKLNSNPVSFDTDDVIGSLDDGAGYNLIATIQDGLGQKAEKVLPFTVKWQHQAIEPSAEILIDEDQLIAKIKPIAPLHADPTDVADIYRLSADKPELIYSGATFGEWYVDPYPALGDMGGHRIVLRTANGDYITEDDQIAMVDSPELGVNPIDNEEELNVIDFNGRQIQFYFDTDYSNTWAKDFQETQYLGGSVQGDWNPAVSRSGSMSSQAITVLDQEMLKNVRRLAEYPGICHVRTADGSSYAADVQVSEDRVHENREMLVGYSLSITRVGPQGFDGMTLESWESEYPDEEPEEE